MNSTQRRITITTPPPIISFVDLLLRVPFPMKIAAISEKKPAEANNYISERNRKSGSMRRNAAIKRCGVAFGKLSTGDVISYASLGKMAGCAAEISRIFIEDAHKNGLVIAVPGIRKNETRWAKVK